MQIRTLFFTNGCIFLCADFVYDVVNETVSMNCLGVIKL